VDGSLTIKTVLFSHPHLHYRSRLLSLQLHENITRAMIIPKTFSPCKASQSSLHDSRTAQIGRHGYKPEHAIRKLNFRQKKIDSIENLKGRVCSVYRVRRLGLYIPRVIDMVTLGSGDRTEIIAYIFIFLHILHIYSPSRKALLVTLSLYQT